MKLYSYFRSSASYRVRIALNLKSVAYEIVPIHLRKDGGRHRGEDYRAINPQMRVPSLKLQSGDVIVQSLAIIGYLNEIYPQPPLLPADPVERARVRAVSQIIACDIHPLNNLGPEMSIAKLSLTNNLRRISNLVSTVLGPRLTADTGEWGTYAWAEFVLGMPGMSITGGSDEILKNIVGERVLGLPKEPRVDK